jgi:hypothetical protein
VVGVHWVQSPPVTMLLQDPERPSRQRTSGLGRSNQCDAPGPEKAVQRRGTGRTSSVRSNNRARSTRIGRFLVRVRRFVLHTIKTYQDSTSMSTSRPRSRST